MGDGGGAVVEMIGAVATAMRYLDVDEGQGPDEDDADAAVASNASRDAKKQFSLFGRGKLTLAKALVNSRMSHERSFSLTFDGGGGVGVKSTSSSS